MAVRRISDLPDLTSNYSTAELKDCLLEVSYTPGNNIYQSFSIPCDKFIALGGSNYTLPTATSSRLGGVKIGSNVNAATDGTISVPAATSTVPGVVKVPDASYSYVGYDSSSKTFVQATMPSVVQSGLTNEDKAAMWPIGSIYITVGSNNPPFKDNPLRWQEIATGVSLWNVGSASSSKGQTISGQLPSLGSLTTNVAGAHEHLVKVTTRLSMVDVTAQKPGSALVSVTLQDATQYNNWTAAQQEGYTQYNQLISNGMTSAEIKALYDADAFKNSTNLNKAYNENAKLKVALDAIVPNGTNTKRWSAMDRVATYVLLTSTSYGGAGKMSNAGGHTHTLQATGAYSGSGNIVRPTSIGVVMWQRIA